MIPARARSHSLDCRIAEIALFHADTVTRKVRMREGSVRVGGNGRQVKRLDSGLGFIIPYCGSSIAARRNDWNLVRWGIGRNYGWRQQQPELHDCFEGEHGGSEISHPVVLLSQLASQMAFMKARGQGGGIFGYHGFSQHQ